MGRRHRGEVSGGLRRCAVWGMPSPGGYHTLSSAGPRPPRGGFHVDRSLLTDAGSPLGRALFTDIGVKVFSEVKLKLTHYVGDSSFSSSVTSLRLSSISKERRTMPFSLPLTSK